MKDSQKPHQSRFLETLQRGLVDCRVEASERPIVVAVSGGPDSVALARGLLCLSEGDAGRWIVAHYNHRWRGAESDADAAWVADWAAHWQMEYVIGRSEEDAVAATSHREESARRRRYEFLVDVARTRGCRSVLVAQTADDQAETVLHHILRGAGLSGLRGIPATRSLSPEVIVRRPLLETPRIEVERFLDELSQETRRDATNFDMRHTRNRIRHDLLPRLESQYNAKVKDALCKLAQQAGDAEEVIQAMADDVLAECRPEVSPDGNRCQLVAAPFRERPRHLVRSAFVRLWSELGWPRQFMGFSEWEALADMAQRGDGELRCFRNLPGSVRACRSGEQLRLERATNSAGPSASN